MCHRCLLTSQSVTCTRWLQSGSRDQPLLRRPWLWVNVSIRPRGGLSRFSVTNYLRILQDRSAIQHTWSEELIARCVHSQLLVQANYLRQLNQKGDPEAVIRQYEGGRISSTEATLGEYVKALVKVDRLDSTALAHTLQVDLQLLLVHMYPCIFCSST